MKSIERQDEFDAINRMELQLGQLRKTIAGRKPELQAGPSKAYELTSRQRACALAAPILLLICFYLSQILLPHDIAHTIREFVTFGQ